MIRSALLPAIAALLIAAASAAAAPSFPPAPLSQADPAGGRTAIPLSGRVTELLTAGGYSYVNLATAAGPVWAAFPSVTVSVGQNLTLIPGYEMRSFRSSSLNRTFDRIVFTAGPADRQAVDPNLVREAHQARDRQGQPAAPPVPAARQPVPLPEASLVPPHAAPPKGTGARVKKATGRDAYTIRELHARRTPLDTRRVTVRAKVVKINPRILKQCWIHLQDGSGTPGGTDGLLVTTTPSTNRKIPRVGDVVTATGTLHKERDYGGGYRYAVILDNTTYRIEPKGRR